MREFYTVAQIKEQHPSVGAYILEPPGGPRIILTHREPEPAGRFCLVGLIEK